MNKKGFLWTFGLIASLIAGIIFFALAIWFSFRIDNILSPLAPIFEFLTKNWWLIVLFVSGILWRRQLMAIANWILGKVGIRV